MIRFLKLGRLAARYAVSGGAAAVVDLGAFAFLYHLVKMEIIGAAIVSYLLAAAFNFVVSSTFVYKTPLTVRRFMLFLLAGSLGLAINTSVTLASTSLLGAPAMVSKLLGIGVAFGVNFLFATFVVFRPERAERGNA